MQLLDCALVAQLAYQSSDYVQVVWRVAHGESSAADHDGFSADLLGTRMTELDPDHVALMKQVPEPPEFSDDHTSDADCYTFRIQPENAQPSLVLAYRGTSSWQDCLCDADLILMELEPELFPGALVHRGFHGQFSALRKHTDPRVAGWKGQILCTGHSLGSIAALAALFYSKSNKTYLRTFGSPKLGNASLARYIDNRVEDHIRVTAGSDPISKMPLSLQYVHSKAAHHVGRADIHPCVPMLTDIQDHDLAKSYISLLKDPVYKAPSWSEYMLGFFMNKLMSVKVFGVKVTLWSWLRRK